MIYTKPNFLLNKSNFIRLFNFINEFIQNNNSFHTSNIKYLLLTSPLMIFLSCFFSDVSLFSSSSSYLIYSSSSLYSSSSEYSPDSSYSLLPSYSSSISWPYFFIHFKWQYSMYSFWAHNHLFHSIIASALTVLDTINWMN